ncbi:E3 ubiquitin-protein ligase TRIM39 [Labeo rohita]|uniref:E3 ubiquitin-protein ligase TRIM39 n=1 Tax=Labeo rohita TaxID=84645 RepID=A0ABQ8MDR9_LABRO|nr:E3 ubiquitin-protein ligase TRIM39 [Labeo rohita]
MTSWVAKDPRITRNIQADELELNLQDSGTPEHVSSRIGVYVDESAGNLSFYSVSDTVSLIHTIQTTFTQPLYPGFTVYPGFKLGYESSVKLC